MDSLKHGRENRKRRVGEERLRELGQVGTQSRHSGECQGERKKTAWEEKMAGRAEGRGRNKKE